MFFNSDSAYIAEDKRDLLRSIKTFLDSSIVLPPGQLEDPNLLKSLTSFQKDVAKKKRTDAVKQKMEDTKDDVNPLERTGKFFGALINDIKRRYTVHIFMGISVRTPGFDSLYLTIFFFEFLNF